MFKKVLLFFVYVLLTPILVAAQLLWRRSLRLLYGDGRSALDGGAHLVRFMGSAFCFFNS